MDKAFKELISLLPFVIVCLLGIVSAAHKKAKRNSEQSSQGGATKVNSPQTVLSRFFGEYADEISTAAQTTDREPTASNTLRPTEPEKPRSYRTYGADARASKNEGGRVSVDNPAPIEVEAEQGEPLDFDLREAVIYSEIMKPKFDE